jgi:alpha-L-rhamnosidase
VWFRLSSVMISAIVFTGAVAASAASVPPVELRCEYRANPLGIDATRPRLSWVMSLDRHLRGQSQTAYRVVVASSESVLAHDVGDLWDSGKVESNQTIHVAYAGRELRSHQQCFWKVRIWDQEGQASEWSETARWTMGMLPADGWRGRWIGMAGAAGSRPASRPESAKVSPLPVLRREFEISKPVARACAYVCGLGFHELQLNGRKVGDHVLEPGWTDYRKRCLYMTYEVTDQLHVGRNALGIMLGNGMYNVVGGRYVKFTGSYGPPKCVLELQIEFADGSSTSVVTDGSWRAAAGPITFSCIYGGEDHDARREPRGWSEPGFDDSSWATADVVDGPGGNLFAQSGPPIKVMQTFKPVRVSEPRPGVYVYDFGQSFSGWPEITVQGPAGATVRMIPAELLDAQGLANQGGSGGPCYFQYTLAGTGEETWHPRFSYYGLRYVQIEGAQPGVDATTAGKPRILAVEGQFVHADARVVGSFACSSPLFGRIHAIITAAIRSNMQSVLTDCPHREKLGWLEQDHLMAPSIMFNYDVAPLYAKISDDMRDAQLDNGLVPDIAPEYTVFQAGFRDSPEWGSACVLNPWFAYQHYGDRRVIDDNYENMKRYVGYLAGKAKDHLLSHGLGDWCDIGPAPYGVSQLTPIPLTATATFYQDLVAMASIARLLGRTADAEAYTARAGQVKEAFNRAFFHADSGQYATGSQTSNAMPLVLELVPPRRVAAVVDNLVKDVRAHGDHLTAGDVGHRYLVQALARNGRPDVLCAMTCRTDPPSYGFQVESGATTLTESWDPRRGFSQNHFMLGHIDEWFYAGLAGINPDPNGVAFDRIIIRPQVVGDLAWVRASYDSIRGQILSVWKREGGTLRVNVVIPANTAATVFVPADRAESVTEGGVAAAEAPGVEFVRMADRSVVYQVGSGEYRFVVGQ